MPQINRWINPFCVDLMASFCRVQREDRGGHTAARGKLNKTVVETLSAIWEKRGMEVLEVADTNPAALAAIVSRLVPQDMVREAITGEEGKQQGNQDITIRLVR